MVDIVVHPHQGEDPQPGQELHHDDGVEPAGDKQHAQEEVGQGELDLGHEKVDDGQQPVFGPVLAQDELELDPVFPEITAVPAQVHAAQALIGLGDHGVDQGAALVRGVVALAQDKVGQGPVFADVGGQAHEGLGAPLLQDGFKGYGPVSRQSAGGAGDAAVHAL